MFLSPSSPRPIASIINKAPNLLPPHSASGQGTPVLPAPVPILGSSIALQITQTPLKSPRNPSGRPTVRHGTRITGVTCAPIHRFLRQARSVHRLGCHHIFLPQVGRPPQRSKIFGIDLDAICIRLLLDGTLLKTVGLRGLSSLQINPTRDQPCLTAFRVPRQAQGC